MNDLPPGSISLEDFLKGLGNTYKPRTTKSIKEALLKRSLTASSTRKMSSKLKWQSLSDTRPYRFFSGLESEVRWDLLHDSWHNNPNHHPKNYYFEVPYSNLWCIDVHSPFYTLGDGGTTLLKKEYDTTNVLGDDATPGMRKRKLRKRRAAFADYLKG